MDTAVETDLHEWLANKNFQYENDTAAEKCYMEYERFHGKYPAGEEKLWESSESIKKRVLNVLKNIPSIKR